MSHYLQEPLKVGDNTLKHRIVMAPLTRVRATEGTLAPNPLMVEYYSQRATDGGLLISEATHFTAASIASRHIPGIFTQHQAEQWKAVTDAVHAKGGFLSVQAWCQGRKSHPSFSAHPLAIEAGWRTSVSASETIVDGTDVAYDSGEFEPYTPSHALTIDEIERLKQDFLHSADLAINVAGFDYIELHAAHGYLFDQFFNDGTNKRTDQYGGSIENRLRFTRELLTLLTDKFPRKIGIRISPHAGSGVFSVTDTDPVELYREVYKMIASFGDKIQYVLITEPASNEMFLGPDERYGKKVMWAEEKFLPEFRAVSKNKIPVFGAGGMTPKIALEHWTGDHSDGSKYDGVAFGRYFISNPDLVTRVLKKQPLTMYDRSTFYTFPITQVNEKYKAFDTAVFPLGYSDLPTFEQQVKAALGDDDVNIDEVTEDPELLQKVIEHSHTTPHKLYSVDYIGYTTSAEQRKTRDQVVAQSD